jgi:osmoprotectant transport system ATP-binding protein
MQVGGHLAQFGPPAEILANPANAFVAQFVGADRGLKRLSLSRVGELELSVPVVARAGDDVAELRRHLWQDPMRYALLVDEANRPIGWVAESQLPRDGTLAADLAVAASPLLDRRTTLKDALSMLLDADVQAGLVVDRTGALRGLITADTIAAFMRNPPQVVQESEPEAERAGAADGAA